MDLDELDDDFGELYAEVEAQPSSAVENITEKSSGSSDELNIVLNDDEYDDTELGSNGVVNEEIESCNLQFKNIEFQKPVLPHISKSNGCNFSLPRSRTILDVNIESLKHKAWKHPGVDITDFFNFGFNEDTWKQYCNHLDTLRHQMSDGRYFCISSRHNMELIAGTEHEKVSHKVQLQSGMISGRAIQVEECVIERHPSTNIWGPLDRDSDVVIQIPLLDDLKEDLITSVDEGVDQTEVDYEDTLLDEAREILSLSASEDELSSLEGDDEKSGNDAVESGRSDKQSPTSGFVSKHLEIDPGNGKTLDADVVCRSKWTDAVPIDEEMDTYIKSGGSAERQFSDAAPSVLNPHFNQGDQSPHSVTPPSSCSHRDYGFDTYADLNKYSNKEKLNLSNYLLEKRDSMTYDCYLSDDSKKYGVKSKPRDHPFCSSGRRAFQPDLRCHGNKPIYVDDDASHLPAKEWFDDYRHLTINQKHNGLDSHTGKGTSYYKTSKSFPYSAGHKLSNYDSRDRYMKRPYRKGSSSEYDLDQNNRENINAKKRHVKQRPRLDHKEGRQGRLFDQGRHALQYMETKRHGRFRQWQPKSDCYLEKEGRKQFRKDVEHDDLLAKSNYEISLTQGDHRKTVSSVVCIRDSVQHTGYGHLSYSRRVKSSGWRSGRCDRAFNGLDDMQYAEYDDEKGGCKRFWSHDSQIRPPSTCRQGLQDASSPRDGMDQTHSRNRKNTSWAEKSYKNDHLGNHCFLDADVKMRNVDNQDCFVRRSENVQCGVSHWNDEHFISQWKDNEVFPSGLSYPYKRHQSRKSIDPHHGLNYFAKHINHRHATQGRFRMSRGHICGQFFQNSNVFLGGNYGNTRQQFRSSIDSYFVGADRKYTGRSFRGSNMCNARNEYTGDNNCMKLKTYEDSSVDYPVKGNCGENFEVDQHGKFSNVEHNESEDIEEGQLLSEELKEKAKEEINSSEDLRQIRENKNLYYENTVDGNEALKGLENPRIQEILAKMERRRERFKRPITLKKDTEKATPMTLHTDVKTCNSNLQRPVRKRRWDGTPHMLSPVT